MPTRDVRKQSRWSMPGFFLGIGVVALVASAVGDRLVLGLVTVGVMVVCAAVLALVGPVPSRGSGSVRVGVIVVLLVVAALGSFVGSLAAGGAAAYPFFWLVMALAVGYVVLAIARRRG